MNQLPDRKQLLQMITQMDFALDDIGLYLDTHPCDQNAIKYYSDCRDMYQKAVETYTKYYGPLESDNVDVKDVWTWTMDPWPWEGVEL